MFNRRETDWIGFKEAQKTISNIKQQVEITEEKLLHVKKNFYETTNKKRILKPKLVPDEPVSLPEHTKSKHFPHFTKETISVSPKILSINNENVPGPTVTKEVLVTSEGEPNFMPFKYPETQLLDLKSNIFQSSVDSFLSKLTSSTDSLPKSEVKHSSSERTSSLIASTYRNADKILKKHETRVKETSSDISKSVTTSTSYQENAYKKKKTDWIAKSRHRNTDDIGMEWKEVSGNTSSILQHNRFQPDNMQKIKDIIDKQKKKQEQYQLQLEKEFSSSNEQLEFKKIRPIIEQQPLKIVEDEQIAPVPIRKVCTVKSLPAYKGFSAPPQKIPTGTRWRKQKNKFTIANSSNTKDVNLNTPKRIKTVVKCESDFVSASHWREVGKVKTSEREKEESLNQAVDDEPSKTSTEKSLENTESVHINNEIKIDIQSILKENLQLSDENSGDSEEDGKNETYSNEIKLDSHLLNTENDQNSVKENKKTLKHKAIKRKAKKSPEKKVISPKIKPYDVDKVRDYMKKKKEERKKRHQDEHRKRMHEAQKKQESLEKLYEYQKLHKKTVAKVKPSSPIKKIDSARKEHENEHVSSMTKDEHLVKYSAVQKTNNVEKRNLSCPNDDDYSKKKHQEEPQGKVVLAKSSIDINTLHKRKQEKLHIDVSFPKFIPVSATPAHKHTKLKDSIHLSSYEEVPSKVNTIVSRTKNHELVARNATDKIEKQSLPQQEVEDVEMIDIEDSRTFKVKDMFRSISTVSTPSNISHIEAAYKNCYINGAGAGVSAGLTTEIKSTELPFPERKSKKAQTLKDLAKCINTLTEPFLRTRKWVEDNPLPPPSISKKKVMGNTDLTSKQELEVPVRDTDSQVESSKSSNSRNSSFRNQVADRKPTFEPEQNIERPTCEEVNHSLSNQNETEDEIIEGSIVSADEYVVDETQKNVNHPSGASSNSSHFSDLQKANVVPDPFNLINTWKRKPLGVTIHDGKGNKTIGVSGPSMLSKNNVLYEEIYKSLISTNSTDVNEKITDSKITLISEGSFLSQGIEQSSFTSAQLTVQHSVSRDGTPSEILSKMSSATNLSNHSFEDSSESHSSRSKKSEKHTMSNKTSHENVTSVKASSISKMSKSHKSTEKFSARNDVISEQLHESYSDFPMSDVSEKIIYETINSDYTLEIDAEDEEIVSLRPYKSEKHTLSNKASQKSATSVKGSRISKSSESSVKLDSHKSTAHFSVPNNEIPEQLHESNHDMQQSDTSKLIVYESINSDYASEIEDSRKEENEVGEFHSKALTDRVSASGSSISEVISVVENSKGFRSSVEDLQTNRTVMSCSNIPTRCSAEDKSNSDDIVSLRSTRNKSSEQQSKKSYGQQSISTTSADARKVSGGTALLLKHDHLRSIPSDSQNSVAVDVRQPLRLTLSNGESVHTNQGYENQYLHAQVVTRVASEAAAAAATSAVIAVFETQRALMAEKNYLGLVNSYGRSSSSKRTQYSSDFESSQAVKSSIHSPESSAAESKYSKSVPEDITGDSNNEVLSKNGSIEEKIISEYSFRDQIVPLKSPQSSPTNSEQDVASIPSREILRGSQNTSQRSKRKISGNLSSPSPASLSENESASSETLMSSRSNFSQLSESALSNDSFVQLSVDVLRRMNREDEMRARDQIYYLEIQEKTLVEKARSEMGLLECLKKKLREKGSEKEVSSIKRRKKELILRLRQERAQLQSMQKAYRNICENHHSLLEDKKKLLKEPISLPFQLPNSYERPHTSKSVEGKVKEFQKQKSSSSTPTIVSDNDAKTTVDEESVSEVPEILKGLASNSSQESVVETQASEAMKTSNSSQNKSQRSSPNPPFSPLNAAQSNSNPSLHSNNSLESALQGLKKLEASKRHLTKREQRIVQRRKQVESLLQWQMKLDSEEMAVRELELKALDIVDNSKKRIKCYIPSSSSTYHDDDKRKKSVYESLPYPVEAPSDLNKLSEHSTGEKSKVPSVASDESIPTNLSENGLKLGNEKCNSHVSSAAPSSDSLPEEIKSASGESSIKTVDATENGSQVDEVISEISYHISPTAKDKSSSSEIYSESFESAGSRKSPSILSNSSPLKNSSPSRSIKKTGGIGIRLPLVPRNVRRHDSSGSDDSYTISQSETASDQSDIEVRIHALAEELKRRKAEAERLKREQKKKYREQLKEKELSLQKQLEAYNQYINQAKLDLEHQIESAVSPTQASDVVVKPRIKWPRPEQVIDSRRVRKQAALNPDSFVFEKKYEHVSSSPENTENLTGATSEKAKVVRKLFPDPVPKTDDEYNKETSEKSAVDSKEISEALSANNSSEIQEVSEIEKSRSVSSEVSSDIKEVPDTSENSTNSSSIKLAEVKSSDSDQKQPPVASPIDDKSSPDTIESKSQTDTFVTESSSSKSLDLNSPRQSDDSNASNRTVSSDDEQSTRVINEISGDIAQKSDTQHSHDISHESGSSEDSISEVQSIINSASPEEDLDNENSIKNSKCDSSDGCKTPPNNEFISLEIRPQQLHVTPEEKQWKSLTGAQSSSAVCLSNKKLFPSESEIINIVNYLSSSLVDDAFRTFYNISKEKCTLKSFLNAKTHKRNDPLNSQKSAAEALSVSLYEAYLKDAFDSFFGIIQGLKNDIQITTLCRNSNVSSEQDILGTSLSKMFNNNSIMKIDDDNEFPINYVTQDTNENQIFAKSSDWHADNFDSPQREQQIQELEQQLVLQQYSYFYRKIPNKPPPPYTPPSSATTSFEFPFVKDKPKEKVITVKEVTRHIDEVVDQSLEILLDGRQRGLPLSEICLPAEDSIADKLELTVPNQTIFIDLIFDLTKEVVLEHYSETKEFPHPWLRPQKLTPKPSIPSSKDVISSTIQKEIKTALKINVSPPSVSQRKEIFWSSLKLGRKKRDFVDTILISELKQEEPDWVNYDQDEVTVKMQIADSIFNVLISDTVNVIKDLQLKTNR